MPSAPQAVITFQPTGRRTPGQAGQNLLEAARAAGVGLEAACGGKGLCGKCLVRPEAEASPLTSPEKALLKEQIDQGLRLACQVELPQGGVVWIPQQSRLHQQVILTSGRVGGIELDPAVSLYSINLPGPEMDKPEAARERLFAELARKTGVELEGGFLLPVSLLRRLPDLLSQKNGPVSLALRQEREVVALRPEKGARALGLAVDLGTTTIVAYLSDLVDGRLLAVSATMNPQVPFGDDVISRISRCSEDPQALTDMSLAAVQCLNSLARDACKQAGAEPADILECVMVGNSAMHHIFLELSPASLATAPYAPLVRGAVECKARELGLELAPEAWLHWLPLKAGFVGADIIAAALAMESECLDEPTLLLDLGTNGEMVLFARGEMLACSTAAGPALEGGHIVHGMRGAPGAVAKARLSGHGRPLQLEVIGNLRPIGFCGSGLVSLLCCLLEAEMLMPSGGFDLHKAGPYLREGPDGWEFIVADRQLTGIGRELVLTSADVAEVQLAKAAIRAGAEVLMSEMGVKRLSRVLLAGAFGNYLDPREAQSLGMFPSVETSNIQGVGNAAGVGSVMALLSLGQRRRAADLAKRMGYVELSGHKLFQDLFVDNMAFPLFGEP